MVAAVAELRQREHLPATGARQGVDGAPDPPVDVPPRLQLRLELRQVVVDIEGGVLDVAEGQAAAVVHRHPAMEVRGQSQSSV